MEKIIYHIDVNSAFLSWEAVFRLKEKKGAQDLRTIPSAVGGNQDMRHGIILAKSIPAAACGIRTGETVAEARRKCPGLVVAPPCYELYEKCSKELIRILKNYTPDVEQYSIDEAFLDMTGMWGLFAGPVETAGLIREQIKGSLGFTVNIGVSSNKVLAKMASDFKKPDRVHTLFPEEIPQKLWPLPITRLFFVGRATAKKLMDLGIRTIGELAAADPAMLKSHLKKQGEVIWAFANGIDLSDVEPLPPANKGYGNSVTTPVDVTDMDEARRVLLLLAEAVGMRLRADGARAGLQAVGIKDANFFYASHQMVLDNATDVTAEIYANAVKLLGEMWDERPLRHLGIRTGRIVRQDFTRQAGLFDTVDYERYGRMDHTADAIRERYGPDACIRAALLGNPIGRAGGCMKPVIWGTNPGTGMNGLSGHTGH